MFESITTPAGRSRRSSTRLGWLAAAAVIVIAASAVLARASAPLVVFAFAGAILWIPLFLILYTLAGQLRDESERLGVKSLVIAAFWAPSIVGGEGGVAPAPAIVAVFLTDHCFFGAIPLIAVAALAFAVLASRESGKA